VEKPCNNCSKNIEQAIICDEITCYLTCVDYHEWLQQVQKSPMFLAPDGQGKLKSDRLLIEEYKNAVYYAELGSPTKGKQAIDQLIAILKAQEQDRVERIKTEIEEHFNEEEADLVSRLLERGWVPPAEKLDGLFRIDPSKDLTKRA